MTISQSVSFTSPVKNEYLETIPDYGEDSNHPVFFLPGQIPVYALFSGKVSYVGQKIIEGEVEFENIIIKNDNEKLKINLFRIAQEALHNIIKYAECSEVTIAFDKKGGYVINI